MSDLNKTSSGTEEDTYRALIKRPYDEAMSIWDNVLKESGSAQDAIEELDKLGWKKDEFYAEWAKRNRGWTN